MIRAILFDCNGIIADDEPIHLELFQKVLREEGIVLTKKQYFQKYLAMDDKACFTHALKAHRQDASPARVKALIARKAGYYQKTIRTRLKIFPGVKSFVKAHRKDYHLAVVSGALRREIFMILKRAGIRRYFPVIVASEDVKNGKPDPACYRLGLARLNKLAGLKKNPLKAGECLAIEDSIHGVESARKAGMKCLAVTNSYARLDLHRADAVKHSLEGVRVWKLVL